MLSTQNCPLPDLIINKLCRTIQAVIILMRLFLNGGLQDPKSAGQNPKGIFHCPSSTMQPVVECRLNDLQVSMGEEFDWPIASSEAKGIVTDEEILNLEPVVNKV